MDWNKTRGKFRTNQIEQDIIRTCGYIKDDQYIASIYGVKVHKVRRLREKVPQSKRAENRDFCQKAEPIDFNDSERANQQMMEQGSYMLLNSLMQFFKERERSMRHASKP